MASPAPGKDSGSGKGSPPPNCKSFRETKSWKEDPGGGAGSLQLPYKIVFKFPKSHEGLEELEEIELERHWNHHIDNLKRLHLLQNCLGVCDVRDPINPGNPRNGRHVGIALSLLMAALSKPPFHGYVY